MKYVRIILALCLVPLAFSWVAATASAEPAEPTPTAQATEEPTPTEQPTPTEPVEEDTAGWFGYAGSSVTANALASFLLGEGNTVGGAIDLLMKIIALPDAVLAPATLTKILGILTSAVTQIDLDLSEIVTDLTHVVAANPEDMVTPAAGDDNTADSFATPMAAAPNRAAQSKNGEPKASGLYAWELHGTRPTNIYYGHINKKGGFVTDGHFKEEYAVNTYFSDDMSLYIDMWPGSGPLVYFSGHKAKLMQDINNLPDSNVGTFDCTTGGGSTMLGCSTQKNIPNTIGAWYYVEQVYSGRWGAHTASWKIQTRRAKKVAINNNQFDAFYYGG